MCDEFEMSGTLLERKGILFDPKNPFAPKQRRRDLVVVAHWSIKDRNFEEFQIRSFRYLITSVVRTAHSVYASCMDLMFWLAA